MGYPWRGLRRHKYNAVRAGGFGSKLESAVYRLLLFKQRAGLLSDIRCQDPVELTCGIKWKVDFSYLDKETGERRWVESKGVNTPRYLICLKLWAGGHGPGVLEIYKGNWRDPRLVRVVTPKHA